MRGGSARFLRRHPLFAAGVILVLAIGIGPVATLASLMNVAFLRPWQVPEPHRLAIFRPRIAVGEAVGTVSIAEYRFLRQHSRLLSHFIATRSVRVSIDDLSVPPASLDSVAVSADYFDGLRVGMALGRGFVAAEEDYSAPKAVAILSHHLWQSHFNGDPAIVGRTVRFGGHPFVIVGVAPRGFAGASRAGGRTDVWMPLPAGALVRGADDLSEFDDPRRAELGVLAGRLNRGATRASAAAELSVLSREFRRTFALPSAGFEVIDTRPLSRWPPGFLASRLPVQALLALTVALLLALACANAANLLLAQAMSRRRESAIQLSLGASRVRIVRQLMLEAGMLSAVGGLLGLALAFAAPRLMLGFGFGYSADGFYRLTSPDLVELTYYAPDALVFWCAFALVSATTIVAGLAPALQASRESLNSVTAERHGMTAAGSRWRNGLLVAQIGIATVLLVGASLLTRAIAQPGTLDPGFAISDVQVVSVAPNIPQSAMSGRGKAFFIGLHNALRNDALGSVALADAPPFWDVPYVMRVRRPESPQSVQAILTRRVSREYFGVLDIPIVQGRIPDGDVGSRELVVNEAAARVLWPDTDSLGRTLESAVSRTEFQEYTVVGVAKNVPVRSMSEIEPVIYGAPDAWPVNGVATLLVRGVPPGVGQRIRTVAASLEPDVIVTERPMVEYVRESLSTATLASRVAWAVGGLGLLLAMVGAFGVFAQAVHARRREVGVRMALGASRRQIAAHAIRMVSRALAWGFAIGFILSVLGVPVLRRFLYGLNPLDPLAYAGVAGILTLAAAIATWIPVRRAMAVDPAAALRAD